jgi:hypothetical protein
MDEYTPRPYQVIIRDTILDRQRCIINASMGLGKTAATLDALTGLHLLVGGPTLVVAPKRVAIATWPDEVARWSCFAHLRVEVVVGTPIQRTQALHRDADIYCINYEGLTWLAAQKRRPTFRVIVADECTRLKSFRKGGHGGQRARALAGLSCEAFIGLTGTPCPNGLMDLWGQYYFVDGGRRLGKTYTAFKNRWFRAEHPGAGFVKLVPQEGAQEQITDRVRDVTFTVDARDWFPELEVPIFTRVPVALPEDARKIYNQMHREYLALLESGVSVEASSAAVKIGKCLQIASGMLYTDDDHHFETIHDEKLHALESIIEEASGMPVLVAYHFQSDLIRLQKKIPRGRVLDADPRTQREWNTGNIPVLFAHPASAGHGLNLQHGGNIIAFFSHSWNLENRLQAIERIGPMRQLQSGYNRKVFVYDIVATRTVDELVLARHEGKITTQDQFLSACKEIACP